MTPKPKNKPGRKPGPKLKAPVATLVPDTIEPDHVSIPLEKKPKPVHTRKGGEHKHRWITYPGNKRVCNYCGKSEETK